MATYYVLIETVQRHDVTIEADSIEEARKKAANGEGVRDASFGPGFNRVLNVRHETQLGRAARIASYTDHPHVIRR